MMGNNFEGLMFPVKTTVTKPCGEGCRVPHPEGKVWHMRSTPPGICSFAFNVIFPAYWTLRFGGTDPSEENPDAMHVGCAQPGCGAQFRVERVSEAEAEALQAQADGITTEELQEEFPDGLSRRTV